MGAIKKKILEYLSHDCRLQTSKLAKILKVPRHRVDYHYKQLIKNKTITHYELLLNYACLGYTEYFLYLRIYNYERIKNNIINFVQNHELIRWVGEAIPKYNLRIALIAKDDNQLEEFIDEINKACEGNIIDREILVRRTLIKTESYSTLEFPKKRKVVTRIVLSKKDKELLSLLSENPKASLVELFKSSKFSLESIRHKIKKWEEQGFIDGFSAKFDMGKLGVTSWTNLLIKVDNLGKYENKIRTLSYSDICFGRTYKLFGKWNLEFTIFVSSYNQLIKIINLLETLFEGDMKALELQITTRKFIQTRVPHTIFNSSQNV